MMENELALYNPSNESVVVYRTEDNTLQLDVQVKGDTVWLTQQQIAELFGVKQPAISKHLSNIFKEGELVEEDSVRKIGNSDFSTKPTNYYNLDVIISVGYRVKSLRGTQFRQWATKRLNEYIRKGFTMDDERLKEAGGGDYWKELLARIRDIRSSEKVMYRQVLDLYATSADYNPKSAESVAFFKMVQNKLHYAVSKHIENEEVFGEITELDKSGRINEIARMLGGCETMPVVGEHARELLASAAAG